MQSPLLQDLVHIAMRQTSRVTCTALAVILLAVSINCSSLYAAPAQLTTNLPSIDCNQIIAGLSSTVKIAYTEVSQGVEAAKGTYIAGRSGAVLVHFCVRQSQSVTISGEITVSTNGNTIGTFTPAKPILANGASANAQYGVLIFEPLSLTTVGSTNLQVSLFDPSNPANIFDSSSQTISVVNTVQPQFYYLRLNLSTNSEGFPATAVVGSPNGDAFPRAVLPLDDQKQWQYIEAINGGKTIPSDIDIDEKGFLNVTEHDKLLQFLSLQRSKLSVQVMRNGVKEAIGPTELTFLYGWINDYMSNGIVEANGAAIQNPGRVGFGSTAQRKGQETYIHETLHNMGLDHSPNPINGTGWDVTKHLPGGWLVSGVFQRKPPFLTTVMNESHGVFTSNSWIGSVEYDYLLNYYSSEKLYNLVTQWPICEGEGRIGEPCILQNNILLRGAFDERGLELVDRAPAFQSPWYSQPTYTYSSITQPEQLPFRMVFSGTVGMVYSETVGMRFSETVEPRFLNQENIIREIPFDARVATNPDDGSEGMRYGAFELIVPASLVDRSSSISVRNINGDLVTYQVKTRARPSIQFVSLENGDLLGNQFVVAVADEDNLREGELECNFTYSPDDGYTWQPLASQLPCTNGKQLVVNIDPQLLPTSDGQGVIEGYVSDGLNVGRDSRSDLSVRSELTAYFEQTGRGGTPSIVQDALVFQVHANASLIGPQDGAGVSNVEMTILDQAGQRVYESTQQDASYCAFGRERQTCSAWIFAEHENQWPSGELVKSGSYTLQARILGQNNSQKTIETRIEIQEVKPVPQSSIQVTPHSGKVGAAFRINLDAFKPGENVDLQFVFAESGKVVYSRSWTMDQLGNGSIQVTSQSGDASGHYIVTATGSSGSIAQDAFDLVPHPTPSLSPSLQIVPRSGTIDTNFQIEMNSFAPYEQVQLSFLLVETGQITYSTLVTMDQEGNDLVSAYFQPSYQIRHYIVIAQGETGALVQDSVEVR